LTGPPVVGSVKSWNVNAVARRLDSKGPGRWNSRRKPRVQIADRARGGAGAETGGRKPEGGSEGKPDGRAKGAGREPGTGGPEPEGKSGRAGREAEAQAEASRTGRKAPEGWRLARASIRERETRELNAGASRQAAGRGRRGRTRRPVPNRREAQAERTREQARGRIKKGASPVRIESPEVHRPGGVGSRRRRGPQGRSKTAEAQASGR